MIEFEGVKALTHAGEYVALLECSECAALVLYGQQGIHKQWHEDVMARVDVAFLVDSAKTDESH